MSDRSHKRQLERARAKRDADRLAARRARSKVVVLVMAALLVLSLVGTAVIGGGDDTGTPTVDDEPSSRGTDPDGASADDDAATGADDGEAAGGDEGAAAEVEPCPAPDDAPAPAAEVYDEPPRTDLDSDAAYTATLATTCGEIVIDLDADGAPRTVENFVALAEDDYYVGTPFHRLMQDFVIQGGDPAGTGCGQEDCAAFDPSAPTFPGYELDDELETVADFEEGPQPGTVLYPRGSVAMANSGPDTAGSQFFIVQADPGYPFPPAYTVFGTVTSGIEVVDRSAAGEVDGDTAIDPVVVSEVTIATR
jgi:cyclophilin family peptidyl-prolyl cis-trans isomerase